VVFSEEETNIFRNLFGPQVIDSIEKARHDGDEKRLADLCQSPRSNRVTRGTFRLNDSKNNEEVLN